MALIEVNNLSKNYQLGGQELQVLKFVSFSVAEGGILALTGRSGSGKSTLMNLIGLLDHPSGGEILLDGQEVSKLCVKELAFLRNRMIGFIFQSFNLLARNTAIENVELPLIYAGVPRRQRRERANEMLRLVGLSERRNHWPSQLSGGEQQRVAIARALIVEPKFILADEPTGALDTRSGESILALFDSLRSPDRIILIVTHDEKVAALADRRLELQDGQLLDKCEIRAKFDPYRHAANDTTLKRSCRL